jgi:hypothetical protein
VFYFDNAVAGPSSPAVRTDGDAAFLLISSASGVLMTGNWQELQLDGANFSSVFLAMPGSGLSVEEVQSVSVFEEIRPAGGVRHHARFKLMSGRVYQECEPSDRALGKRTTVYQKR